MKNVKCSTQAELDEALKNPEVWPELVGGGYFTVSGSAQVTAYGSAQVRAYGSAQVRAYGSAQVRAYGSAQVTAYDSAQVRASGSAQVTAYDSAQVRAYGSAQVTAYDSAQVRAYDSAQVRAYDSAQVTAYGSAQVTASKYVAITKTGGRVNATGGVQIDYQSPQSLAEWFEEYGVAPVDGIAILYKAVGSDFKSERGGDYTPGTTPKSDSWNTTQECGSGLHFCGTPHHALGFYREAKRFVACPVAVDSIAFTANGDYPTKVKAPCVVAPGCYEVDINGK